MVHDVLVFAATMLSIILFLIVVFFSIECIAGSFDFGIPAKKSERRPAVAILVPAHNEELHIADTIGSIKGQMQDCDRLLVVADNCNDLTAEIARQAGAEVIERFDEVHRGKGYALDAGIRYLSDKPPEVVVIVDADCWLEPGALDELARMSAATNRPLQSRYLMVAHPATGLNLAVAEFAFLLKNRIRLLGLKRLGLPAQLTGSGMAFPWSLLRDVELANGHLVEDMKLGLDLARMGHPPLFCDGAVVKSNFPYVAKGLETQSARWNGGRFLLMKPLLLSLFESGILKNGAYKVMIADALVPPLTLLLALIFSALIATGALAASGLATLPFLVSALGAVLSSISISIAWWCQGTRILPAHKLVEVPRYAFNRISHYPRQFLDVHKSAWIRTDRGGPTDFK